jgi:hypothetical protein
MSTMKTITLLCLVFVGVSHTAQSVVPKPDSMGVVAGTVVDALSGEPLRGNVVVENTVRGSSIDSAGRFAVLLAHGKYRLLATAVSYADAGESATVSAACTTRVDFRLLPRKYVDDSIMASLAKIRIRELARHPEKPAVNNSIRLAAWKTLLSGKGTCGLKNVSFGVEGQHISKYLVIENGSARIITDSYEGNPWWGRDITERMYSYVQLVDRHWEADSSRFIVIPFSGAAPKDRELRFALSNHANDRDPVLF